MRRKVLLAGLIITSISIVTALPSYAAALKPPISKFTVHTPLDDGAKVVSGGTGYCALLATGGVDCWGKGALGELGNGTFYNTGAKASATPVVVE